MILKIYHEGCWTSLVNLEDSITLNYNVYPEKNYFRLFLLVPLINRNELKKMPKMPGIIKLNKITEYKNYFLIDFLNKYKESMGGYLYDKEVLFLNNVLRSSMEIWEFALHKDLVNEVINDLKSYGKIVEVKVEDFDPYFPNLSEAEIRALRAALNFGYLDYPRRMDASEVAERLGISKITFLHQLRNAQKKLTEFFIRRYYRY
jgi:predicted DNA binding protein